MAVSFSFVMGAPTILAAMVVEARPIGDLVFSDPGPLAVGFVAALISGGAAMGMLKWVARRGALPRFAPYCFLLCAICLALGAAGR
jgi:undecaprenyl pyrophosphate phosphatase UppP